MPMFARILIEHNYRTRTHVHTIAHVLEFWVFVCVVSFSLVSNQTHLEPWTCCTRTKRANTHQILLAVVVAMVSVGRVEHCVRAVYVYIYKCIYNIYINEFVSVRKRITRLNFIRFAWRFVCLYLNSRQSPRTIFKFDRTNWKN